jgi:hypothetical protein
VCLVEEEGTWMEMISFCVSGVGHAAHSAFDGSWVHACTTNDNFCMSRAMLQTTH